MIEAGLKAYDAWYAAGGTEAATVDDLVIAIYRAMATKNC
jgi:hypothetical protein